MADVGTLFARRAELQRAIASVDEEIGAALGAPESPAQTDEALSLKAAAALLGEPPETFRRRLEYRKALISRPGELRLRFSLAELERIRRDRLAGNGAS